MVDSRWIEWRDADRFDTYPGSYFLCARVGGASIGFSFESISDKSGPISFYSSAVKYWWKLDPKSTSVCTVTWQGAEPQIKRTISIYSSTIALCAAASMKWRSFLCQSSAPYLFIHRRRHSNMNSCTSSAAAALVASIGYRKTWLNMAKS